MSLDRSSSTDSPWHVQSSTVAPEAVIELVRQVPPKRSQRCRATIGGSIFSTIDVCKIADRGLSCQPPADLGTRGDSVTNLPTIDAQNGADLLAQPTRSRLFATLQELRRTATTEELAAVLDMHVNGVRRHLERMHEGGLLERRRARHGRGRPRDEWSVAADASPSGALPDGYTEIARWLARAIPTGPGRLRQVERTGREVGRELAPGKSADLPASIHQAFSALGFRPALEVGSGGSLSCELRNCPYRESVRENPEVVCALHRGITVGLLEQLDPDARLTRFEPRDPDRAGCMVEIAGDFSADRATT